MEDEDQQNTDPTTCSDPHQGSGSTTPTSRQKPDIKPARSLFDELRLPQDFADHLVVTKILTTVPVRKPSKQEWIRVHAEHRFDTFVLELKEERETYLVGKEVRPELMDELKAMRLHLTVTRQGTVFFWPVNLPTTQGRIDSWSASALAAVEQAKTRWVRVKSNMSLGAYEPYVAPGEIGEPEWPDLSLDKLLDLAFKDRMILSVDHPVVRRLRGMP